MSQPTADLTRLQSLLASCDSPVLAVGGVIHHLSPTQTSNTLLDAVAVGEIVEWLGHAPRALYGPFVSASGVQPYDFLEIQEKIKPEDLPDLATYANALATPDSEWDRQTRDDRSKRVAHHASGSARLTAQSSVEFASLDMLSQLGMDGISGAVAAFADVRRVYKNKTVVVAHQFARSRHAVFSRFTLATGVVRLVVTPWCLSKQNAIAVAAVMTNDLRRTAVADRVARRARTAVSFMSRLSLQSIRDVLSSATSLLTRYAYDSSQMAFVNPSTGAIVQTTATRQVSVNVAFAYVFTNGADDVLVRLANSRASSLNHLMSPTPPEVDDYFLATPAPIDALSLFSRALTSTRRVRDVTQGGSVRSKGAMLGYQARARKKYDRNTVACINRLEEVVSLLLHRGVSRDSILLVVEWGGDLNDAAVLAAAALANVDIALDVAASGVDIPGADVLGDSQDRPHRYQLYLSSAHARALPRVPVVEYGQGEPMQTRLTKLLDSLAGTQPNHQIAFIAGGVQHALDTPVSVCVDAVARHIVLRDMSNHHPIAYFCAEVLLPPGCHHALLVSADVFLEKGTLVNDECSQCQEHHRAVMILEDLVSDPDTRLVKPRSVHGHNGYFSSETVPGASLSGDTVLTLDAAISMSHARNCEFGEHGDPGVGAGEFESTILGDLLKPSVQDTHRGLSGGDVAPMGSEIATAVASSIKG